MPGTASAPSIGAATRSGSGFERGGSARTLPLVRALYALTACWPAPWLVGHQSGRIGDAVFLAAMGAYTALLTVNVGWHLATAVHWDDERDSGPEGHRG